MISPAVTKNATKVIRGVFRSAFTPDGLKTIRRQVA
jgi:hypothetical protein